MRDIRLVLLDTNVWLDYYLGRRKGHGVAVELVRRALQKDIDLLYAMVSVKDVYYLVASEFKRLARESAGGKLKEEDALAADAMAWGCVTNMSDVATAVGQDVTDVWLAQKQEPIHRDLEDNLVAAAAMRAKADFLVTSDAKFLRHCAVAALTPDDLYAYLGES